MLTNRMNDVNNLVWKKKYNIIHLLVLHACSGVVKASRDFIRYSGRPLELTSINVTLDEKTYYYTTQ